MARHNRPKRMRASSLEDRFDREYIFLPEYPQFCTITAIPMKTIFINLAADPKADDFHVARSENDRVLKKLAARLESGE